jgi:hypothetical protein
MTVTLLRNISLYHSIGGEKNAMKQEVTGGGKDIRKGDIIIIIITTTTITTTTK